jgi:hypothetical protein
MDMKLSVYAKLKGICYQTAWNRHHAGELDSYATESGSIYVRFDQLSNLKQAVNQIAEHLGIKLNVEL